VSRHKAPAVRVVLDGIVHAIGQVAAVDFGSLDHCRTRACRKARRAEILRYLASPPVSLLCERGQAHFRSLPRTNKPVSCMACIAAQVVP
jgi:hypothetical protein